jgi:hypothetical protein
MAPPVKPPDGKDDKAKTPHLPPGRPGMPLPPLPRKLTDAQRATLKDIQTKYGNVWKCTVTFGMPESELSHDLKLD